MDASRAILVVAALAMGCSGASDSSAGRTVATLDSHGQTIGVSVDGGAVYVIFLDSTGTPRVTIDRVSASEVTAMPIAQTDWSDYAADLMIGLDPPKTALVSGGTAYFLGGEGVTVVPLDGSPSRTLYQPLPAPYSDHAHNVLGSFTADDGRVYLCYSDVLGNSNNFGRFHPDGTWEVLFIGTLPAIDESCYAGAMAADADAVYWSTSQAIRAYRKGDGAISTVVDLGGLAEPPSLLGLSDTSVIWFDWFDIAFHAASKNSMTPDVPPRSVGRRCSSYR